MNYRRINYLGHSIVKKGGDEVYHVYEPNLLHCYKPAQVWVYWTDTGMLSVYTGKNSANMFVFWVDEADDSYMDQIREVMIGTHDGDLGTFSVPRNTGIV